MPDTPWIIRTKNRQPQLRLFCFPYAGGGASVYRHWSSKLPPGVELCPVQLPGRENRMMEPPFTHITPLVQELEHVLTPYLDLPFLFFGYSLGALIAFELTRQLRRNNLPGPNRLFVAAHRAPQLPHSTPTLHNLPNAEFINALYKLGGTPEAVLQHEELMQMLLPVLRADFSIYETYVYSDEAPLSCPLTVFGGEEDPDVRVQELAPWREQTTGQFNINILPGNHFFLHSNQDLLLGLITHYLHEKTTPGG